MDYCRSRIVLAVVSWMVVTEAWSLAPAAENWPCWRGPRQDGHSSDTSLPVKWDAKGVTWKTELKGTGQSSPIIWGDRIFLTTALDKGQQRVVFCVDRRDGKVLWEKVAWTGQPEPSHYMNGWASATCVTDGELVIAFFGRAGIHCYTVEGEHRWSRDLGSFESPWGVSACPLIVGNLVIQNGDSDADAFIAALDKRTGETVWRTARPDNRGWSSPIVVDANGHRELAINSHSGVRAYDPSTGKELWFCKSFNGRGEPTVTPGFGMLFTVNGLSGDVYAVRPGGSGDVTKTQMAWHTPRKGGRDTPSPILIDTYLIISDMKGLATCYDAPSGKELWKERIGGNTSGSPIAANGLAYFQTEAGKTAVIKPGKSLEIVAENDLGASSEDELFRASLTPYDGQIFSRSTKYLYCIGPRSTAQRPNGGSRE